MKISDFVAQMGNYGAARTNRYTIDMEIPKAVNVMQYGSNHAHKMRMFCEQIQLPGLNVNTTQVRTFGEIREMPYEFNYDPIQMIFYVDSEMVIKGIFDDWIQNIQLKRTRSFQYYVDYICPQMSIHIEDVYDKRKYSVGLYEVYPKNLGPVQLGYEQKNVMTMQVTMVYKYWKSIVHGIEKPGRVTVGSPIDLGVGKIPDTPELDITSISNPGSI